MLPQNQRRVTQTELTKITFIKWGVMSCIHTLNNSCKDTKNLNHKTYRIQKLKFAEMCTKKHSQTHTQTVLTTRYEKPYRKTKKRTLRYGFKNARNQWIYMSFNHFLGDLSNPD